MRTYLEISALALVVCAGLWIASCGPLPTSDAKTLASPPASQSAPTNRSTAQDPREIQVANLPTGDGILRIPHTQPGYLIVTSASPESPTAEILISRFSPVPAARVSWQALPPLEISGNESAVKRQVSADDDQDYRGSTLTVQSDVAATPHGLTDETGDQRVGLTEIKRTFFLHITDGSLSDPRQYAPVHSRSIAEGDHVRVYLDRQRTMTPRIEHAAQRIIETLEIQVIPRANREIGTWDDVDEDGKLSVLLTPWLEKLQGGKTSLKGFVRGSDFRSYYPKPFSNQADVIYLNSELSADVNYLTLLAHEYWHVLQCSYRLSMPEAPLPLEADWISEGTAHLAEIRFGGGAENLEHRIDAWLASPESAPLAVENYYAEGLWRHDGCRGATYLFFHWCEELCGRELSLRLLTAPNSGAENLQQATGVDFETLQTHWAVAMLDQCQPTDRIPGYTGRVLLANTPVLQHIQQDRLRIRPVQVSGEEEGPMQFNLAPTATCYLKVEPGDWKIETKETIPLRVTFVPDHPAEQFADSLGTDAETGLR